MSDKDRDWLIQNFPNYVGRTLRGDVLTAYLEAERIILNREQHRKVTCNCQLRDIARSINELYNKWLKENQIT